MGQHARFCTYHILYAQQPHVNDHADISSRARELYSGHSSVSILYLCEMQRLRLDCQSAQACLSLCCMYNILCVDPYIDLIKVLPF